MYDNTANNNLFFFEGKSTNSNRNTGRGEIDVLAVLIKDGKFVNCSHIEVSVSVTGKFPYNDTSDYIIKKFFSSGAEKKITEFIGNVNYFSIFITSDFRKNTKELLRKILLEKGGVEVISMASTGTTNVWQCLLSSPPVT